MSSPFSLALPSGPSTANPNLPLPFKKKRKQKALQQQKQQSQVSRDLNRDLDENDDVSDTDLVEAPRKRARGREVDEDYDEEEDEVDEEDADEGEVEGERGTKVEVKRGLAAAHDREEELKKRNHKDKGARYKLRGQMDNEQADRFDTFSTVMIPRSAVARLGRDVYGLGLKKPQTELLAGMAKIFVAEVTEIAKDIQAKSKDPTGPLRPYHLRLAKEEMQKRGVLPSLSGEKAITKKPLFKR